MKARQYIWPISIWVYLFLSKLSRMWFYWKLWLKVLWKHLVWFTSICWLLMALFYYSFGMFCYFFWKSLVVSVCCFQLHHLFNQHVANAAPQRFSWIMLPILANPMRDESSLSKFPFPLWSRVRDWEGASPQLAGCQYANYLTKHEKIGRIICHIKATFCQWKFCLLSY